MNYYQQDLRKAGRLLHHSSAGRRQTGRAAASQLRRTTGSWAATTSQHVWTATDGGCGTILQGDTELARCCVTPSQRSGYCVTTLPRDDADLAAASSHRHHTVTEERLLRHASAEGRRGAGRCFITPSQRSGYCVTTLPRDDAELAAASSHRHRGAATASRLCRGTTRSWPLLRHTVTEERLLRHASAEGRRGAGRCCATPSQGSGYCVTTLPRDDAELAAASSHRHTPPLLRDGAELAAASVTGERLLRHGSAEGRRGAGRCFVTPSQRSGYCVTPLLRDGAELAAAAQHRHRGAATASCLCLGTARSWPLLRHTVTGERLLRHDSAEGRRGAGRCFVTPSQRSGYCVTPSLRKELARCSVTPPLRDGGGWLTAASHLHRHRGTAQRLDGYCDISPQRDARSGSSCRNTTYKTGAFRTIVYCSGYVSDLYVNSVLFAYVKYVCVCVLVCMGVCVCRNELRSRMIRTD